MFLFLVDSVRECALTYYIVGDHSMCFFGGWAGEGAFSLFFIEYATGERSSLCCMGVALKIYYVLVCFCVFIVFFSFLICRCYDLLLFSIGSW